MSELIDAEMTLVESTYNGNTKDDWSISRWTQKGDRLYLNGPAKFDKYSIYADLETQTVEGTPSSSWKTDVSIDGDVLTITIEKGKVTTKTYVFVVEIDGGGFEDDDNDDSDEDNELATDGGKDVTSHVDDDTIEYAIAQHDDPTHEDATTVEEVRDALAWLQQSIENIWWDWMTNLENGEIEVVHEDNNLIVFSTGPESVVHRELRDHYDGKLDERGRAVVDSIHHAVAREHCDFDWGVEYPLVLCKSEGIEDGQRYVHAIINDLLRRGLSPGQAWAYYGVEIRGNSRNVWAERCGYSNHSAVSEAVRKAKSKLP